MQATIQFIRHELKYLYPEKEIEGFIRLIFEWLRGYSLTDMVINKNKNLLPEEVAHVGEIVGRLKNFEPLQYILGAAHFYGLKLKVTPAVLIPRPETEELVDWIVLSEPRPAAILDIGTGSGCIALALKSKFNNTDILACDVSHPALEIAKENAEINNLPVSFFYADILSRPFQDTYGRFDIIVSNPPYVTDSEQAVMNKNVLENEPTNALFVPDDRPLLFYEAILDMAAARLKSGGKVYFEINENFGNEMTLLMEKSGFTGVEIRCDLQGKNRMIRGTLPVQGN